jgi:integrase
MPAKSANTLNFTKTELAKVATPAAGYDVYHDTSVEGLVLLVYSTGGFRFYVYKKIDGKPVRIKVGKYPDMSVEAARKKAQDILGAIARGERPTSKPEQKPAGISLGHMFAHYIDEYCKHHCTTWKATSANFNRYFADWLERAADTISHNDVQQMVNKLGAERGHHTANRAFDDLRAVLTWGRKHGYFQADNPCDGVTKFKTRSRERFLTPDEFEKFFTALKAERNIAFRDYVYLSLFTGARQANVLSMRWEDINFELGLWRIPITKNKESQTLPLTNLALQVLVDRRDKNKESEEWVFPSDSACGHIVEPKKAWWKFLDKCGIEDLRLHDLRRTLGSYMAMNNQSLQIIGKVLGHKSPAATQIYSRLAFDPLRQAMENAQASMASSAEILPADMAKQQRTKTLKSVK